MKISTIATLCLSLCVISSTAYATGPALKSSQITLSGGNIAPTQSLVLMTNKLIEGAKYQITCNITDQNNKTNPVILKMYNDSFTNLDVKLNGVNISGPQFKLTNTTNVLQFKTFASSQITITNLDQTDSVIVDNCSATATFNN